MAKKILQMEASVGGYVVFLLRTVRVVHLRVIYRYFLSFTKTKTHVILGSSCHGVFLDTTYYYWSQCIKVFLRHHPHTTTVQKKKELKNVSKNADMKRI